MKFIFVVLLICVQFSWADTINFCYEDQPYLPYLSDPSVRSENQGLLLDLIQTTVVKRKINVTFQRMPWKRCLKSLEDGGIDAAFALIWTPERDNLFAYPKTADGNVNSDFRLWRVTYDIFANNESNLGWDGINFTNINYGLSAPKGYVAWNQLKSAGVLYSKELNPDQGLALVSLDRLDGFIVEKLIGQETLKRLNITNVITPFEKPYMHSDWYVAFSKQKYAQDKQLVDSFWQHLMTVRLQNENNLINKYD